MTDAPTAEPTALQQQSQDPPSTPPSQSTPRPTRLAAAAGDPPATPATPQAAPVTTQDPARGPVQPTAQPDNTPPLLGDDLSLRPGWVDALPEEYREHYKTGAKFDNLGGLLKSYSNLERLRSIPLRDAPDEVKAAFRDANKIPGDPAEFAKQIPLPEGQEIPPELIARAAQAGLEANMHPSQMGAMIDFQLQLSQDALTQAEQSAQAEKDKAFEALEKEWGRDTEANYSNATSAAKMLGLDIADPNIGDNPSLLGALAKLHSKLDEDTLRSVANAGPVNSGGGMGDRAKARDIVNNPANPLYKPYHDPSDPAHERAHQQVDMFNAAATGFRP